MVKVSIIIPTYNRGYIIKKALNSVYSQTFEDYEILVVDGGSTDNTEKIMKDECIRDSRVRYIRHKINRGISVARNAGILKSGGEYIAFLDSDDRWLPTKLKDQIQAFQRSRDTIGLIYTGFLIRGQNKKVHYCVPRTREREGYIFKKLLAEGCFILISSVIVPRKILDEVGLFDKNMICEDYDLWLRITKKHPVKFISKPLVDYNVINRERLSLKYDNMALGLLFIYNEYRKDIKLLDVKYKYFFTIGAYYILGNKGKLGRYIIIKTILENPKKMRYILFFFFSLFIKIKNISLINTKTGELLLNIFKARPHHCIEKEIMRV